MEMQTTLGIVVGLCIALIVAIPIIDIITNYIETGEVITTDELECKEFCNGDNYYFDGGGFFSGVTCECKEVKAIKNEGATLR